MPTAENVIVLNPTPQIYVSRALIYSIQNLIWNPYYAKAGVGVRSENPASTFHITVWKGSFGVNPVTVIEARRQVGVIRGVDVDVAMKVERGGIPAILNMWNDGPSFLSGLGVFSASWSDVVSERYERTLTNNHGRATNPVGFNHLCELTIIDESKLYSDNKQKQVQDYLGPINPVPPFQIWSLVAGLSVALVGFLTLLRNGGPSSGLAAILRVLCVAVGAILVLWSV